MAEGESRTYEDKHRGDYKSRLTSTRGHDEHVGISSFSSVRKQIGGICHWLGMMNVCTCVSAYAQGAEPCGQWTVADFLPASLYSSDKKWLSGRQ